MAFRSDSLPSAFCCVAWHAVVRCPAVRLVRMRRVAASIAISHVSSHLVPLLRVNGVVSQFVKRTRWYRRKVQLLKDKSDSNPDEQNRFVQRMAKLLRSESQLIISVWRTRRATLGCGLLTRGCLCLALVLSLSVSAARARRRSRRRS